MEEKMALSVDEARSRLGLSRGLMYEAVRSGRIPSFRVGRRILIPVSALLRKLEALGVEGERRG
jgi:excisionase family DNA binding protein